MLLLVAAIALGGIYVAYSTSGNLLETEARLANDEYEILARNAALAGLNDAAQELAEDIEANNGDFTDATISGNLDNINYASQITEVAKKGSEYKRARITSTGTALTTRNETVVFDVQAEYNIIKSGGGGGGGGGGGVPLALQDAVNSKCDADLGGSVLINAAGDGSDANVHTNGNLQAGNKYLAGNKGVKGFGLMGGSLTKGKAAFFSPGGGIGGSSVKTADPISDDDFDEVFSVMQGYRDIADYYIGAAEDVGGIAGTVIGSLGEIDFTKEHPSEGNPLVIWIGNTGGTFHINGGTYPEYTIFVADGDVKMNGNASIGGDYQDDAYRSTVAFYVGGDLDANGGAVMSGQFFVKGGLKMNGNFTLNGNITTQCEGGVGKGLNGNFTINYAKANPALTTPNAPATITMERATHSEW